MGEDVGERRSPRFRVERRKSIMNLSAISIGYFVPRARFDGRVRGLFHRACNVRLDDGRLITLLASDLSDVPQGVRLNTPPGFAFDALPLEPGQAVACRAGVIRFSGSAVSIDLRTAQVWRADLSAVWVDMAVPRVRSAWHVAWTELHHRSADGLSLIRQQKFLPADTAGQAVDALLNASRWLDATGACAAAEALIGLGLGLTPSGDDFLVGYLAGLQCGTGKERPREKFTSVFSAGVVRFARRTTEVSRAYLEHAAQGRVSRVLFDLARAIGQSESQAHTQRAARAALQVGSTSGADSVLGLLLGLGVWTSPLLSF